MAIKQAWGLESVEDTLDTYLKEETSIMTAVRYYRGYGGQSVEEQQQYAAQLMASRWSSAEIDEILRAENLMKADPSMLSNLNQILAVSGLDQISGPDLVDVMRGNAPTQVYEAINDAFRAQALREQGVQIDPQMAAELGEGTALAVASAEMRGQYTTGARQAALDLIQNWREVDLAKLGIGRDEIIQAAFGEGFSSNVEYTLQKFLRERQMAGQGWGGVSAYQGERGNLVVQGYKSL